MTHLWTVITSILFAVASVLLIFIVLLQRGRGGGLAGAFGATGGQSAFGTRAGDVFTRITIGVAVVWVALAAITGFAMTRESRGRFKSQANVAAPDAVLPEATPKGAGGAAAPFEAGDQKKTNAPATKGGTTTPATGTAGNSSSTTTKQSAATPPATSEKKK
jgi:preprotein translocase subunit SecG